MVAILGCTAEGDAQQATATQEAQQSIAPATVTASGTPQASVKSAVPSPTPSIVLDAVAQVVTSDLVQRSEPRISPESEIYPDRLNAPTLLYVIDGPVEADGYEWYLVVPFRAVLSEPGEPARVGWVAAAHRDGERWIEPATLDCAAPSFEEVASHSPYARLACFGNEPITLEGVFDGFGAAVPGLIEPAWLTTAGYRLLAPGSRPGEFGGPGLFVHAAPGVAMPSDDQSGATVRVEGHFDHPAARTCAPLDPPTAPGATAPPPEPFATESLILYCRAEFVVTDVSVVSP